MSHPAVSFLSVKLSKLASIAVLALTTLISTPSWSVTTTTDCYQTYSCTDDEILGNLLRDGFAFGFSLDEIFKNFNYYKWYRDTLRGRQTYSGSRADSGDRGVAAAALGSGFSIWTSAAHAKVASTFQPLRSSGKADAGMVGVDYLFSNDAIAGVVAAPSRTRINTQFNNGNISANSFGMVAYGMYPLSDSWSVNGALGLSDATIKIVDNTLGARGERSGKGTSWSIGAEYAAGFGDWNVAGRSMLSTARDKQGAFTYSNGTTRVAESAATNTQLSLGVTGFYSAGSYTPFFGLTYMNDLKRQNQGVTAGQNPANDRDGFQALAGVQWQSPGSLFGSAQISSEVGRKQVKNDQIVFNIGIRY